MKWLAIVAVVLLPACILLNPAIDKKQAARANTDLGLEYMNQGQTERALEKLEKALKQDPTLGAAHAAIAILHTQVGEFELADKHYRRALFLEPDNATFNNNYGAFLCAQDKVDQAVVYFERVVSNPHYPAPEEAYTNMGMCLRRKPDLAAAEKNFRLAIDRNPRYAKALSQLAIVSFQQNDYLQARAFLQRYESITKPTAEMLLLGVRTEKRLGNDAAAAEYAQKLRNTYPGTGRAPYAEALD